MDKKILSDFYISDPFPSSRLTGKNLPVRREDGKGSLKIGLVLLSGRLALFSQSLEF